MALPPPPPGQQVLGPFEPRLVRQRKRRARAGFKAAAFLHHQAGVDLADRLEAITRNFTRTLVLGGGGLFSTELGKRPPLAERPAAHGLQLAHVGGDRHQEFELRRH